MKNTYTENEIKMLKEDLYDARHLVIRLLPVPIQEILESYSKCKTLKDTHIWLNRIAEELITLAKPIESEQNIYHEDRAYCPLCGEGTDHLYRSGYSLPEGLRRHLTGHGSTKRCEVIKVAYDLALEHTKDKFPESYLA